MSPRYKKTLVRNEEDIKSFFFAMQNRNDIAKLLEVDFSMIAYLLYQRNRPVSYKTFSIKKKSGGLRIIDAPINSLKLLQAKLASVLYLVYEPRQSVYGFCKNKDIVDHAQLHTGKRWVFNLDLKDFFSSIHIGRVIGLFEAPPFLFPRKVAVTLAQIACYKGVLPQGAPTSPVISNMICAGMDRELQNLAKANRCVYSRYADDISFSSTKKSLPYDILNRDTNETIQCGKGLERIIERNSFFINPNKVRINNFYERQSVTGLITNLFPNVPRSYVRNTRAMLYSWKTKGDREAEALFNNYFPAAKRGPGKGTPAFREVVAGRINFIGMVRGHKNAIYRKLRNEYNVLAGNGMPALPVDRTLSIFGAIWVLRAQETGDHLGTAFNLKGFGLVTCQHVVNGYSGVIRAHKWNMSDEQHIAHAVWGNQLVDLAVLHIKDYDLSRDNSLDISSKKIDYRNTVTVVGCPSNYRGDTPQIYEAKVAGIIGEELLQCRYSVDRSLFSGMSGSPVLDEDDKVVGIATHGATSEEQARTTYFHLIASIAPLIGLHVEN